MPWEKFAIWGLFLLVVYVLRDFFFVIFMTFIISFCMRSLVVFLSRRLSPGKERLWLQYVLAVICFLALLGSLYGVGKFIFPQLIRQGESLVKKFSTLEKSPRATFDEFLRDSVGQWLFQERFGTPEDPRYIHAFRQAQERGIHFPEYETFRELERSLDEEFERSLPEESRAAVLASRTTDRPAYDALFRPFYEERRGNEPSRVPFTFEQYTRLREAHDVDPLTFSRAYEKIFPTKDKNGDRLERERLGFESHERTRLVEEWKKGELAEKLEAKLQETLVSGVAHIGRFIGEAIPNIIILPVQLALALLLSFFITIDVPRLKKGVARLKESRIADIYEEISPGLVSFGRLIGRAFQAQGVIAIVNTILTFLAIRFLGVENEIFLCFIVFLCSFIPVLGTVFSSVPIAMMAMIQDNGSVMLAVWVVIAILVVHFIETSILNPKILGEMLHLHPVLVLAILAIGEHFFGVWGLLLGVPVMVYIIRFVILDEGIPGLIEPIRRQKVAA